MSTVKSNGDSKEAKKKNENWQQISRIIRGTTFKHYKFLSNEKQKDKFMDQVLVDLALNDFEGKNDSSVKTPEVFKVACGDDCVKDLNGYRNYVTSQMQTRATHWMRDHNGVPAILKHLHQVILKRRQITSPVKGYKGCLIKTNPCPRCHNLSRADAWHSVHTMTTCFLHSFLHLPSREMKITHEYCNHAFAIMMSLSALRIRE